MVSDQWKLLSEISTPAGCLVHSASLKVPGGMIIRTIVSNSSSFNNGAAAHVAQTFVPDPPPLAAGQPPR